MIHHLKALLLIICVAFYSSVGACTIVAVSGKVTVDGRPLLLKNRDSSEKDVRIRIIQGTRYAYICQSSVSNLTALSGFNEVGFAIVSSHSYNMPNSDYRWNATIMQKALEGCATVDEFEFFLDTLSKPISVCSNYGVMDAQGHVAIFETNAYSHVKYDADKAEGGYLIRTNHSLSESMEGLNTKSPSSIPRFQIASAYLDNVVMSDGYIAKEHLLGLVRCLVNSEGEDLCTNAPFDENSTSVVDFHYYIPRYNSTSAMVIQGILPDELPQMTVAWTMVGPPLSTVTIPFLITDKKSLPQKAKMGTDGSCWLSKKGQQLKSGFFMDAYTIDLSKLYNIRGTGIMQKICHIEETIMSLGNELVNELRLRNVTDSDIAAFYSWVDSYLEEQYAIRDFSGTGTTSIMDVKYEVDFQKKKYYDMLGRYISDLSRERFVIGDGKKYVIVK